MKSEVLDNSLPFLHEDKYQSDLQAANDTPTLEEKARLSDIYCLTKAGDEGVGQRRCDIHKQRISNFHTYGEKLLKTLKCNEGLVPNGVAVVG